LICSFAGLKLPSGQLWFCATVFLFEDLTLAMTDLLVCLPSSFDYQLNFLLIASRSLWKLQCSWKLSYFEKCTNFIIWNLDRTWLKCGTTYKISIKLASKHKFLIAGKNVRLKLLLVDKIPSYILILEKCHHFTVVFPLVFVWKILFFAHSH